MSSTLQHAHAAPSLPSETLQAFGNDALRARIFHEKYALRDADGTVLEQLPAQMWQRVSHGIAAVETPAKHREWADKFDWLLADFRMVPGGRILHAIGNPNHVTALNCYVVPAPHDSLQGIYHTAWELAETFKRGGGCGVDLSSLRPKYAPVRNASRVSTGAVSFMELYSVTTGIVGQEGRRGALMLTMSDSHPDVLDFCRSKRHLGQVRYANISVRVTDAFMQAVERHAEWQLQYTNAADRIVVQRVVRARELWEELLTGARDVAEPGCLFWDTIQRFSASDRYPGMGVVSTNPCGEEALEPYGDCCLGSVNLSAFVLAPFTPQARLDLPALEKASRFAVRFLDNVLTWNQGRHPLPQHEEAAARGRRIGVGLMGLADMLCQLGLKYDTDAAVEKAAEVVEQVKLWVYDASADLAAEKGPFPAFEAARHFDNPFFTSFPPALLEKLSRQGLRNVTLLTIAPTGTIAALAGCTSGIEPIFALSYTRRSESLSEREFAIVHPLAVQYRMVHHLAADAALPDFFTTAHRIDPAKRVLMQGTLQHHIDQAISSTINLPRDTSRDTVEKIYRQAWEAGCKGITVYREGSREGILLSAAEAHGTPAMGEDIPVAPRPPILPGLTFRQTTPLGTAFITVNHTDQGPQEPFEVFVRLGKAGSDLEADAEALGRLISLILRLSSPTSRVARVQEIIGQLEMIGGAHSIHFGPARVRSLADGIARVLTRYLEHATPDEVGVALSTAVPDTQGSLPVPPRGADFCPRCRRAALISLMGCLQCAECGFREC
ncbi:MAG TPA: adenosylcobalamin-dependent ribonucleoside-diphosphate reductase [Candidatus Tectomicrobia bacterium]